MKSLCNLARPSLAASEARRIRSLASDQLTRSRWCEVKRVQVLSSDVVSTFTINIENKVDLDSDSKSSIYSMVSVIFKSIYMDHSTFNWSAAGGRCQRARSRSTYQ